MLATLGQLTEFRVTFNGNRGSVALMYGDKKRKRTRGKKPCAPGAVKGGGPKPEVQLPAAVPSFVPPPIQSVVSRDVQGGSNPVAIPQGAVLSGNRKPASPARTTGKVPRGKFAPFMSPPPPSSTGRSTLPPYSSG